MPFTFVVEDLDENDDLQYSISGNRIIHFSIRRQSFIICKFITFTFDFKDKFCSLCSDDM